MPRGLLNWLALSAAALLLAACGLGPTTNRYQQPPGYAATPAQGAVEELQRDARAALDDAAPAQAIEYLQRAIRIEPRNAESWQMLAEAWQRAGDPQRCVEMAERAASYGSGAGFEQANRRLLTSCRAD